MTKFDEQASGVYVIAVTPFTASGEIDWDSIDRMVEFYLQVGATGLTVLGMMGEAQKLTLAESQAVVKRILARVGGRIPVVVGVSAPGFAQMQSLSETVMAEGAAAVMVAPPGGLKTDDQIVSYYHQVVDFIGEAPFVLQDFPLATGVQISVPALARIVKDLPTCVCLKHEDWPGLEKISSLRAEGTLPRRISILCGNGGLFLPEELERGADGAMTGFAYPEMMVSVEKHHRAGTAERGRDLFDAYLPLARFEQQPGLGLAIRKFVLAERGIIATPTLRKPGASLTDRARQEVRALMNRQERRLAELG